MDHGSKMGFFFHLPDLPLEIKWGTGLKASCFSNSTGGFGIGSCAIWISEPQRILVLIPYGCYNNQPQTWLKTAEISSLPVLEAGSLK